MRPKKDMAALHGTFKLKQGHDQKAKLGVGVGGIISETE
jgi:hypothetical protein